MGKLPAEEKSRVKVEADLGAMDVVFRGFDGE